MGPIEFAVPCHWKIIDKSTCEISQKTPSPKPRPKKAPKKLPKRLKKAPKKAPKQPKKKTWRKTIANDFIEMVIFLTENV